jgi:two-component system, NtrC family, sensor histidine kinase HydH
VPRPFSPGGRGFSLRWRSRAERGTPCLRGRGRLRRVVEMKRGTWIAVSLIVAVFAAVAALAARTARRERTALVAGFSEEHLSRLRFAAREVEAQLLDIGKDLEFATRLVGAADSGGDRRRELRALLAVVRAYRMVVVYDRDRRRQLAVVDPLAPLPWSSAPFEGAFDETARAAMSRGSLAFSPLVEGPHSPWYRVFATPLAENGEVQGAVAILVDLKETFERLRVLAPEPSTRLVVLRPDGTPAPTMPGAVASSLLASSTASAAGLLLEDMRAGATGTRTLPARDAAALGLGAAEAIAAFVPVRDGAHQHWAIAILDSTDLLRARERAITMQVAALGAALAVALGLISLFLVTSARRAIAVEERLRSAEQVAHLREQAEKILDNIPVGVIALDGAGRISAVNRASRDRVPSSMLGGPAESAFPTAPPEALEELRGVIAEARSSGTVQRVVARPLALSGTDSFFAVHAVPLAHPLADLTLLLVVEDLTELRALSSQLLRAEKLATVGVLAAGIAHEIGTPLGVVRGRAELIASRLGADHPQTGSATVIVTEIDRISRTIRELLDFARVSRATAGQASFSEVARTALDLLALEADSRGVSLRLELSGALPPVAADADQLQQVLVNIALNAIHACAPGGRVAVRARAERDVSRAIIEVVDDGAGIPEELQHRVFDPFFTTKKRGKGTGLGLTISAQIVRNHGGDIRLESAIGRGTSVVMSWPLAPGSAEEADEDRDRRAHLGGR